MPSTSDIGPPSNPLYICTPSAENGKPNAKLEDNTWGKLGKAGKDNPK